MLIHDSYSELVTILLNPNVVKCTKACLQRIHLLCSIRHRDLPIYKPEAVNVRIFLAGYMMAFHPTSVFESSMGDRETAVFDASTKLFPLFQSILDKVSDNGAFSDAESTLTEQFLPLLFQYLRSFEVWKNSGNRTLVSRVQYALIALENTKREIQLSRPSGPEVSAKLSAEIEKLRANFVKIAGADALARFDEQRRRESDFPVLIPVANQRLSQAFMHELYVGELTQIPSDCWAVADPFIFGANRFRAQQVVV